MTNTTFSRWKFVFLLVSASLFAAVTNAQESGENTLFDSVMPKNETQASAFLKKYPDYNGKNTIIAVLDTGVDPTAQGLRITPDGQPKVIDVIDATGSGDVDMSHSIKLDKETSVAGIRGNTLILDPSWKIPSRQIHLGLKAGYDFIPGPAIAKYKQLEIEKRESLTRRRVREIEKELLSPDLDSATKSELNERIKQLNALQISFNPPTPFYDCITFNDGNNWVAVIDTNRNNDFRDEKVLKDYHLDYELGSLEENLGVTFGIHIYDDGKILSIVSESGAHGTHVAGIIAGYFPDSPAFDGVAPGAKIVSIKIGDNRIGTMETMTAMERALSAVVQHKCDLINMSYGEPTTLPDEGRISDLIHHTVRENNVIFVASAGNAGPALYTVGAPGGTTGPVLGIGAYISPGMAREQYAMSEEISEGFYSWSSRGPTFDGDIGVDFAAPGGAYAPVPQWSEVAKQQMNGTSMAAPNACGNIALILSGLKANGISYTPVKIERTLSATTRLIDNASRFAQGRGLIQVLDAYENLKKYSKDVSLNIPIDVYVSDPSSPRGIQAFVDPTRAFKKSYRVGLTPWFSKDAPLARKLSYQKNLILKNKENWISIPDKVVMLSDGARINVQMSASVEEIDLISKAPYFTEIEVFDEEALEFGPVARIPITIIGVSKNDLSSEEENTFSGGGPFQAGEIERAFINPPQWAEWAEIQFLRSSGSDEARRFVFHSVQRIPGRHYRHHQDRRYINLNKEKLHTIRMDVTGGVPMEVALAPYWSVSETSNVDWKLKFFGNHVTPSELTIEGNQGLSMVTIHPSPDKRPRTMISPSGSLDKLWRTVLPTSAKINPLLEKRDELVDKNYIYELILEYPISLKSSVSVMPVMNAFQDRLYESEFSSQLWEIWNNSNQRIYADDTWPAAFRLQSGDYTLVYHFRHPDQSHLNKIKNTPIALEISINSIPLKFYKNPDNYLVGKSGRINQELNPDSIPVKFYAGVPFNQGKPSIARPGDLLVGKVRWISDDPSTSWNEAKTESYRVVYSIPIPSPLKKLDSKALKGDIIKGSMEKTIRSARINFLKSLSSSQNQEFDKTYQSLLEMDPNWLEVIQVKLHRLDNEDRKTRLDKIIETSDQIIQKINQSQLAKVLNVPDSFLDEAEKKSKGKLEIQKEILIDALYRKCRAIAYVEDAKHKAGESEYIDNRFDDTFKDLSNWTDTKSKDSILVHIRNLRRDGKQAQGLALLSPHLKKTQPEDKKFHLKKLRLLEELDWAEWVETQKAFIDTHYPKETSYHF